MNLKNSMFGEFELPEDAIYTFPHGMLGYEHLRRYGLVMLEEYAPFSWLVAVDEPEMMFPLLSPVAIRPDYLVPIGDVERRALEATPQDTLVPFAVVTVSPDAPQISANMRGPVLLNPKSRKGMQIVLFESTYPVRAEIPVIPQAQAVR